MTEPQVGGTARLLGYTGLLPQVAAVGLMLLGRRDPTDLAWLPVFGGYALALLYGSLILSFLGGIWWGFAMRREHGQKALAVLSVLPSLVGAGCALSALIGLPQHMSGWPAVTLGSAILLTLLIDRQLAATGEAPARWMALRAPLSLGLGALTIAAGLLIAL